jgi:2-polyprenyl-3-methyl-5-hydroxy-6-metoxy-1,4-benzoquinol methylase
MKIKIAKGNKQDGIVIGNAFDKYGSSNLVVKIIMNGFDKALARFVNQVSPKDIHEVGCGEGYWVIKWQQASINARGSDFSSEVIAIARENAQLVNLSPNLFAVKSIYELQPNSDSAELIVCCEVMEHLKNPEAALQQLQVITGSYLIVSVPREPVWRMLNILRAKYLRDLGNTPGHIQHWSKKGIIHLVQKYFDIVEVASPFPWTMMLCKNKKVK